MLFLLLFLFILCVLVLQLKRYNVINRYPGPSSLEVFKFLVFSKSNEEIYRYIISLPEKYGPVVKIWMKPFTPALLVTDPSYFEHILWSKEHLNRTSSYQLLTDIAGKGLVTQTDLVTWKLERKILTPAFNHKSISEYSVKFKHHTEKLKAQLEFHENKILNVQPILHRSAFNMILDILIGENVSKQESIATDFITFLETYLEIVLERTFSLYKFNNVCFRFTKNYKKWTLCCETVHKYVDQMVKKQIEMRRIGAHNGTQFLDILLNSGLSYNAILNHTKTFILGRFETTGQSLCFTLFELSKRLDIQEKIFNEYISIVGMDKDAIPSFTDLQSMTYTECVLKETLRLYPTVPIIQRLLKRPQTINNITIPSGIHVLFSILTLHKSPGFERPLEFDPDRFLPQNIAKLPKYSYVPFSAGPRDCIGRKIALLEMKIIVSFVVRNFTLHSVEPEHKLDLIGEFTLKSKNGIPIIFKKKK